MAYDKLVDSAALDAGMTATANAIRAKTGSADPVVWDSEKGFQTAVEGISAGGDSLLEDLLAGNPVEIYSESESVAATAFKYSPSVISVNMPNVKTINTDAFAECSKLSSLNIPNIVSIGNYAFQRIAIKELIIPDSCTTISGSAFRYVPLEKIVIPASVKSMGGSNWTGSVVKTAGPIGGGYDLEFGWTETIPDNGLNGAPIESFVFPDGLKTMGVDVFNGTHLTEFIIPEGVTQWGDGKWCSSGFSKVERLVTPTTLTTWGAMLRCTALKVVDVLGYLDGTLHYRNFEGCTSLETLILRSTNPDICMLGTNNIFGSTPIANGTGYIYVPRTLADGSDGVATYQAATNWSAFGDQIRAIEDYPEICGEVSA